MNYLALLSVCASYAPGFFYNLSDWFQEERSLKLKSRIRGSNPSLPPHLDEYSSQKLSKEEPSQVLSAPIQCFPTLSFLSVILPPFFQPPENCIFWAPTGYVSLRI